MLRKRLEQSVRSWVERQVSRIPVLRDLAPDALTFMTLGLTFGVIALIIQGALFWAGLLFLAASACDVLDGALARAKQATSRFGAFLDSTVDRYSEMLVFLGLLIHFQRTSDEPLVYVVLVFLAVTGSLLTSYVRARAEALGFTGRGGVLERPERVLILTFGLISGWIEGSLWILAILAHLSVLQRSVNVWVQSRSAGAKQTERLKV